MGILVGMRFLFENFNAIVARITILCVVIAEPVSVSNDNNLA
jgi:hypothetical protein